MTTQLDPTTELEEAEARLETVRRRIGSFDAKVTPEDLNRAESAVRFAEMRIAAEADAEAQRQEQARQERITAIRASLPAVFDTAAVDAALAEVTAALDAYCGAAKQLQVGVSDLYNDLARQPVPGISVQMSAWTGVTIGGHQVPNFQSQVDRAVEEAFRRHHLPRIDASRR